jgi:hypothetical protein
MKVPKKDIKKFEKIAHLLDIYSRDREEYDEKESREASRLANFIYNFALKAYAESGGSRR